MISLAKLRRRLGRNLMIAGLVLAGTGPALLAAPAGGWLSPNGARSAPGDANAPPNGTQPTSDPIEASAILGLPLPEVQNRARQLLEQMRSDLRHVQYLQQIARKAKDVLKLNCVNDKLVQVKPQMNIADLRMAELESASDATRVSVFESITEAAKSIQHLREEADQCIGEPIATGSEWSNTFTSPEVPDDPNQNGLDDPTIEAPGYASPFD